MKTVEHLRELFAYNDWANRRIVVALKEHDSEKSGKILAHILIIENYYYEKMYGTDFTDSDYWQNLSIEECGQLAREIATRYEKLIRRFDEEGLDMEIPRAGSENDASEFTYRELLTHVLFHSSIHRGNIILKLREDGFQPPRIDYSVYLRETKYI